jgi:DNA-binding transcriptional regulator PaaX
MSKKYGTFTSDFLKTIGQTTGFFEWPLEGTLSWAREQVSRKKVYDTYIRIKQKGLVREVRRSGKVYLELTKKGLIETLLAKANFSPSRKNKWDGKWRMVVFDIPEEAKKYRDKLRRLLKINGFKMLQGSVFISPFALNRDAIDYLKETGLIEYIRLARVDELDDDRDLKKSFKLS